MTLMLRYALLSLGYTVEAVNRVAAVMALKASKGEPMEGDTAGYQSPSKLNTSPRLDDPQERITNLSHALFGGFTPTQVRRLLAMCRYRGVSVDRLELLMHELRRQSWARGWCRVRDTVEALA